MLYQPKPQDKTPSMLRRSLAAFIGLLTAPTRTNSAEFDGLSDRHLEELGLRRTDNGGYRFFD